MCAQETPHCVRGRTQTHVGMVQKSCDSPFRHTIRAYPRKGNTHECNCGGFDTLSFRGLHNISSIDNVEKMDVRGSENFRNDFFVQRCILIGHKRRLLGWCDPTKADCIGCIDETQESYGTLDMFLCDHCVSNGPVIRNAIVKNTQCEHTHREDR